MAHLITSTEGFLQPSPDMTMLFSPFGYANPPLHVPPFLTRTLLEVVSQIVDT